MKYTILGFKQADMVTLNITIDELLILNYFTNYISSGKTKTFVEDGKNYHWIMYEKVLQDLPILKIQTRRTVARKFDSLVDKGMLLSKVVHNGGGSYTYFSPTELIWNSQYDDEVFKESKLKQKQNDSDDKIPYKEIITYLNETTNQNFRIVESHKKHIRKRWSEGMRLEDFIYVVDVKYHNWKDTEWQFQGRPVLGNEMLRPKTIFGNNMDDYRNESKKQRKKENHNAEKLDGFYS